MSKFNVIDSLGLAVQVALDERRREQFLSAQDGMLRMIGSDSRHNATDAREAMSFLVSQLAYTESQAYEKLYTPMQYEQLLPISYEAGEWADTIRYEFMDYSGQGKRTSGKGKEINLVDVAYADKSFTVVQGDIGYDYSSEELRRTAYLRRPISTARAEAAIEAYKRHMNVVGLQGEASSGFTGLFNNPLVPTGNAPVGLWQTGPKTPAQILSDINTLIFNVWNNTAFNDMPTDILLPPTSYNHIATTPRDTGSDMTILEFVRKNNIAKTDRSIDIKFSPGYGLDTAGAGSTKRAIAYVKSPQRVVMHIPLALRFLAPQAVGLSIEVPGEYKYAGVEFRYPKSAYYMDNL
jgi:hypothetical protein